MGQTEATSERRAQENQNYNGNRYCFSVRIRKKNYNYSFVYDYDRRKALDVWKSRVGGGATYRALIEVFLKAGRLDCADAVCGVLKDTRVISTCRGN